jgi:hypothetical protein
MPQVTHHASSEIACIDDDKVDNYKNPTDKMTVSALAIHNKKSLF